MHPVDKFMLAVGILWSLFTLYAVAIFLPPLSRRLREWEVRGHPASRVPTYPQRFVLHLLTLLMTAVSTSAAFHHDLLATIGINSGTASLLMIMLPALYFALGWLKKSRNSGHQPGA
jgi:drug/metabolite transporter (DMT)-like permease